MLTEKANILIVEDNDSIRTSLSMLLAEYGYTVRAAEDGFSALVEMRNQIPDILVSDLHMPGMSGFELLSVVRVRYPGISVIAMSGAFSGDVMPPGVTADYFHTKGASLGSLLLSLKVLVSTRPSFRTTCCTAAVLSAEGQA
jgi:CheY-like chemotaxis protein